MKKTLLVATLLFASTVTVAEPSTAKPVNMAEKVMSTSMFSTGLFAGCFKNLVSPKDKTNLKTVNAVWTSCAMQATTFMLGALPELGPAMVPSYLKMLRDMADDYLNEKDL